MRGESDIPFERTGGAGLTPAHAGRITNTKTVPIVRRVDPRACGGNCVRNGLGSKLTG